MIDVVTLRLSAQGALLGHTTDDLRAATVHVENTTLIATFFHEGPLSEILNDCGLITMAELAGHFPWLEGNELRPTATNFTQVDRHKKMTLSEHLIYLRYEPGCEVYRQVAKKEVFTIVNSVHLRLAGMRALLGRVTKNLRGTAIYEEGEKVILHFYYNDAISALEHQLAQEAILEVMSDFQLEKKREFEVRVDQVPFPERLPWKGNCLFARYEDT